MTPATYIKIAISTFAISVILEITFLAGTATIADHWYHVLHFFFMATLIFSQLSLFSHLKKNNQNSKYALWFALGMSLTAIGDYVNSANSGVEPISNKLTAALFLFGAGYIIYNFILWSYTNGKLSNKPKSLFARYKYFMAIPFLLINLVSWLLHVEANLKGMSLLYYGSFIFNLTIYVAMPLFAFWYFYITNWSIRGLIIFCGAILIPYSDLILFNSWLANGNPSVPSHQLYAYNWILYFGGQTLMSMYPSFIEMD